MILGSRIMVETIDWTDLKAVAITALEIFVFTQMMHGGSWKVLSPKRCWYLSRLMYHLSEAFSVGCMSTVSKSTQIMEMKGNGNKQERNKYIVCSVELIFNFWSRFLTQFVLIWCTSHCIVWGSRCHMTINPIKSSYCFKDQLLFHWHYIFHVQFFKVTGPSITS